MITTKKQKVLNGIAKNLFAKILGYPTVLMFSSFKTDINYEIDILTGNITPQFKLPNFETQTFSKLLKWFNQELITRKIDKENVQSCNIHFLCEQKKFLLFIPVRNYHFKLSLVSNRAEFKKKQTVSGHL